MGCHIESSGSFLGGGISAPFREDFVQVFESSTEACGQGDRCAQGVRRTLGGQPVVPHAH